MAKMVRKADLPRKDCAACGREMVWRRKWSDDWDEVPPKAPQTGKKTLPHPGVKLSPGEISMSGPGPQNEFEEGEGA